MTKKNELEKKEAAPLATMPEGGWGDGDFEAKDLLVPMICVAQGVSEVVKQGKAKANDIYETVNKTVLGDSKNPVKFIPVKYFKTWVHCEVMKNMPEFRSVEPYTVANSNRYKYEETREDGTTWRNYEVLNFYVLLEKELEEGNAFPYLLSFRSSNKKKGRPLINHMARARALTPPQPICSMTFSLSSVLTSKDKNSWFVFDLTTAGATPEAYKQKALEWLNTLNVMTHKIDEQGIKEEMGQEVEEHEVTVTVKKGEIAKEARY